jgi:hypothetical protein
MHVVILNHCDVTSKLRIGRRLVDRLEQLLAGLVRRVGLPRKNELHGFAGGCQDGLESRPIAEQQRRPLVSGEPSGKSNR